MTVLVVFVWNLKRSCNFIALRLLSFWQHEEQRKHHIHVVFKYWLYSTPCLYFVSLALKSRYCKEKLCFRLGVGERGGGGRNVKTYKLSPVRRIRENVCLNIVQIQKKCEGREKQGVLVIIWCNLCRVNQCITHSSFLKKILKKEKFCLFISMSNNKGLTLLTTIMQFTYILDEQSIKVRLFLTWSKGDGLHLPSEIQCLALNHSNIFEKMTQSEVFAGRHVLSTGR